MQCIYSVVLVSGVAQSDSVVHRHRRACARSLSCIQLFATPWTVARQAPLSMGFSRTRILEWVAISSSKICICVCVCVCVYIYIYSFSDYFPL